MPDLSGPECGEGTLRSGRCVHFLVTSPTSRSPLLRDRCPCVLGRGEEVPGSLSPAPHPLALTQTLWHSLQPPAWPSLISEKEIQGGFAVAAEVPSAML